MTISGIFLIAEVTGVTKAKLFKNLKAGDFLEVKLKLADPGHGRSVYATKLQVTNLITGESTFESLSNVAARLRNFDLVEMT